MLVVQISLRNTIFLRKWAKKGLWKSSEIDDKPNHIFFFAHFHEIAIFENKETDDC